MFFFFKMLINCPYSSESAGVKRFDNVVENDISFYQSLSNTTSFEKVRHHLFKKANSLLTGKSYEIPQEIVAQILSAQTTDEDKLNRASLIIMQQWPADDKKFTNILKLTLSSIIDVAHIHNKKFMEKIITAKRYSELAAQKLQSTDLRFESEEILDKITKSAENGHESQIYLTKRKMTELEKNYDSEVL